MLYVLVGEDDFSVRQSLEEIKRGIGDPTTQSANTTVLDGQQLSPDQLKITCQTAPFLGEKRLVIVSGLLARFETRNNRRRKEATTPQNDHKPFLAGISQLPESTVLVLVDRDISKNNPLQRELPAGAEIRTFHGLTGAGLRQWILGRVTEKGGKISPGAVDSLARLVGGDLWSIANDIDKLVLFASERRIEEADVRRLASSTQETSVFAMTDAVLEFNAALAEQALQRLLQGGASTSYLLSMLTRQFRMIVRAKELKRQGTPAGEIQRRLGLAEFALRKTLEQAGRYSWDRLKDIYGKLLDADLAVKTGRYDDELALNILLAEVCQPTKR